LKGKDIAAVTPEEKGMNESIRKHLDQIRLKDLQAQNAAFLALLKATEKRVDWAYEAWDELLKMLMDRDNHVRAIGAQLLCNLAKAIPEAC
jgi:cytochrome c-type biogenesis protein CcmH/NrfG